MNKTKALDLIDKEINDHLLLEEGIAKEMAHAIHVITKSARTNINARLGWKGWQSSQNLSFIIAKEIQPVLSKIFIASQPVSEVLECINTNSSPKDIEKAERLINSFFSALSNNDQIALDLLRSSLLIFRIHFAKNQSRIKQSDDSPYCRFCYREARINLDTCDDHAGTGRTDGKRQLKRYQYLKSQLRLIRESENISNEFVLKKLKSSGLSEWNGQSNDAPWIEQLLKNIRACSQDKETTSALTEDLAGKSKCTLTHKNWPSMLEGTLFRYEVYKLMEYGSPSKEVAKRLDQIWGGVSVIQVAKESNIKREPLYRRISIWGKRVNDMRTAGVADSVIKVVLGLEVLPENSIPL